VLPLADVKDDVSRRLPAVTLASAVAGCALLAAVDPDRSGIFPECPTRLLLGMDCPACGTLRGLHALLRGRVLEALDHNVLLIVAVPLAIVLLLGRVAPLVGRPARAVAIQPRLQVVLIGVAVAFAITRNLPFSAVAVLGSGAG
jgi:hypothetical protein